jgi:hypothetical protein
MGRSWELQGFSRIVAVGDIHGDLDALVRILIGSALLTPEGEWNASDTALVLLGDLNDRGRDSVNVMQFVMDLEAPALDRGSVVCSLLGNHELLACNGDYRYVPAVEVLALESWWFEDLNGLHAVYRGNSPYARWIRNRPTMVKVGGTVFVHAGLGSWPFEFGADAINDAVNAWAAHLQGVAPAPDETLYWLVNEDGHGPLWTGRFAVEHAPSEPAFPEVVRAALQHLGADRLVVGHRPTKHVGFRIAHPHPVFGDGVALIDTGISSFFGGRLSALRIEKETMTPCYFQRGDRELQVTGDIRRLCEQTRLAMPSQATRVE